MNGIQNRHLAYRPLVGGIAVQNQSVGLIGTIGMAAESDDGERWVVSCYHVLCRSGAADFPSDAVEPIYQPYSTLSPAPVAVMDGSKADKGLDVAAARVVDRAARGRILGLPNLAPPAAPRVGMRVLKGGAATGVTEGWIATVTSDRVRIVVPPGYGQGFELSNPGDSGAVWIDAETCSPVALHFQGSASGPETAAARPIQLVFETLKLKPVVGDAVC